MKVKLQQLQRVASDFHKVVSLPEIHLEQKDSIRLSE